MDDLLYLRSLEEVKFFTSLHSIKFFLKGSFHKVDFFLGFKNGNETETLALHGDNKVHATAVSWKFCKFKEIRVYFHVEIYLKLQDVHHAQIMNGIQCVKDQNSSTVLCPFVIIVGQEHFHPWKVQCLPGVNSWFDSVL